MGGIGTGWRTNKTINSLNPATASGMDSLTFMLDFGLKGQYAPSKTNWTDAEAEYLTIQLPLFRTLSRGIGLKPLLRYADEGEDKETDLYSPIPN